VACLIFCAEFLHDKTFPKEKRGDALTGKMPVLDPSGIRPVLIRVDPVNAWQRSGVVIICASREGSGLAIVLINCFEVPMGREDEFLAAFRQVNAYMRAKPGYLGHKLHRALAPEVSFRFINVVQWASAEQCRAAHDAGFRELISKPEWAVFRSTPGLYEIAHQAEAEEAANA
jgi:heme-degrading monooxygenase HmoA